MNGLEYMWSVGYKHRDIKPENMLLDSDFNLKFADFGFASTESTSSLKKGTEGYLGPEAYLLNEFQTEQLDIFASGIVLFIMFARCPPFNSAKGTDPHYKLFVHKNESFWAYHEKRLKGKKFSNNFKLLLNAMLSLNPLDRPNIKKIKEFDWFNETLPDISDVNEEMFKRFESLKSMAE